MRNVLADLTRPAPPIAVRVRVRVRTVTITLQRHDDPRVQRYELFRHAGARAFAPGEAGVTRVCRTTGRACTLRRLKPAVYRFAAIAVDEWGTSAPVLSAKIVVRRRR